MSRFLGHFLAESPSAFIKQASEGWTPFPPSVLVAIRIGMSFESFVTDIKSWQFNSPAFEISSNPVPKLNGSGISPHYERHRAPAGPAIPLQIL